MPPKAGRARSGRPFPSFPFWRILYLYHPGHCLQASPGMKMSLVFSLQSCASQLKPWGFAPHPSSRLPARSVVGQRATGTQRPFEKAGETFTRFALPIFSLVVIPCSAFIFTFPSANPNARTAISTPVPPRPRSWTPTFRLYFPLCSPGWKNSRVGKFPPSISVAALQICWGQTDWGPSSKG